MVLDAASLDAILQEARSCFLYEDAPDYVTMLEQGMQRLLVGAANPNMVDIAESEEYAALMRAAHSLKGGAGIAQLPSLSELAHQLEDLLQALNEGRVQALSEAYELLSLGIEQVKDLITLAVTYQGSAETTKPTENSLPIVIALERFVRDLPHQNPDRGNSHGANQRASAINPHILKTVLEVDLEDCLQRVEGLLQNSPQPSSIKPALTSLVEECTMLGQTLELPWLLDTASHVSQALTQTNPPLESIARKAIALVRQLRTQTLNGGSREQGAGSGEQGVGIREQGVGSGEQGVGSREQGVGSGEQGVGSGEDRGVISSPAPPATRRQDACATPASPASPVPAPCSPLPAPSLNLRIPVTRLDRMNNTLGELLIAHERLSLYQSQLYQANLALKKEAQQLNPINEKVRVFYDQLATPLASSVAASVTDLLGTANSEFDALQFDQYTAFHGTLQDFQEVMVRVQEARADIELITRDVQEALDQLRQQLDSLRGDLTQSRLVPFRFLAQRFVEPLLSLNQRYHKSVELAIVGEETLVDQAILEQLQTPLTHLLRNAFDHGIETPEERLKLGKPEPAKITMSVVSRENQVVIAIADNGRGIDPKKVYQRAVQMGLCRSDAPELTKEQILEFLFMPGFTTAASVTAISGRGVGLDVVRLQVERLRGSIQIETKLHEGTKFTITIPLTLSILPLLLCRCQKSTLAIPSSNILEIISLSEFCDSPSQDAVIWQNRRAPLFSLTQLLPYSRQENVSPAPLNTQDKGLSFLPGRREPRPKVLHKLGIVLSVSGEPIVAGVDSLLGEKELVLKPFDATVQIPAYIAGCTVLGTGEVVPVLSPNHFGELIALSAANFPADARRETAASESHRRLGQSSSDVKEVSTIVIVDDSVAVRRLLDRVLSQSGYQVVQCRDGKEALEVLNRSSESYDLLISDIEMPTLDGFALLKEIRSHPRWHNLPVAMLTSRGNEHHQQKAKDLGATAYFTKPFQPAELVTAIAALLT